MATIQTWRDQAMEPWSHGAMDEFSELVRLIEALKLVNWDVLDIFGKLDLTHF